MLATVELRWFFQDEPSFATQRFDRSSSIDSRVDWYAFPCHPRSGIKFREGRLETKLRLGGGAVQLINASEGIIERWRKWYVDLPASHPPEPSLLADAGWIAVEKSRRLLRFDCNPDGVSTSETETQCDVQCEWTRIVVEDELWWTLGFEASEAQPLAEQKLLAVANHLSSKIELTSACSYGYPEWLNRRRRASR